MHADAADWRRAVAGFSRARLRDCRATRPRHGRKQHDDDLAQAAALASSIRPLRQRGPACAHELWRALSERFSDIAQFSRRPLRKDNVLLMQAQEFHSNYWGHLGLLDLTDHFLTPDFSSYRESALSSPYPHNGVIASLAHAQHGLVGYAHPFDSPVNPDKDPELTNALPADVALGNADYYELVGFSDHRATADIWYRLLNLGFRLPAGAGTDAMANYASLRGPVGVNRVFIVVMGETTPKKLHSGLKQGRTFVTNGPLLGR